VPVEFLSDDQADAYERFVGDLSRPELEGFFLLDGTALDLIEANYVRADTRPVWYVPATAPGRARQGEPAATRHRGQEWRSTSSASRLSASVTPRTLSQTFPTTWQRTPCMRTSCETGSGSIELSAAGF
jgi:hypothetical protein